MGLLGAYAFDHTRLGARLGYVYDQAAPIGEIILGAPTQKGLFARFQGRAAHAGIPAHVLTDPRIFRQPNRIQQHTPDNLAVVIFHHAHARFTGTHPHQHGVHVFGQPIPFFNRQHASGHGNVSITTR